MAERASTRELAAEARLLRQARDHDRAAIRQIVQQHNQRLYRIARSIVRNDGEAEDVLQEAYCRAFSRLHAFRGEARIGTWLARIVINEALGRLRRNRSRVALAANGAPASAEILPFPGATLHPDPEASAAQREIKELLQRAIDALPSAFRTIFVARIIEGISIEETAALFGIPPETVKTRLHRARRLLKRELEKHVGPALTGVFPFGGGRCDRLTGVVLHRLGLG